MKQNKQITQFIEMLLKGEDQKNLLDVERARFEEEGLEVYIFNRLTRKKFRPVSISDVLADKVKKTISKSVKENKPIHITIPFGGYKKWQLEAAPNVGWADVFVIGQLRDMLYPISQFYKHEVVIEFYSDEIMVARTNNISQKDLDTYNSQMMQLCAFMQKSFPEKMEIKYSRIRDVISYDGFWSAMDKDLLWLREEWENNYSEEEKSIKISKAERNYKEDWVGALKEEKYEILKEATLCHDAFIEGHWRDGLEWAFSDYKIAVGFRYTYDWGLPIKSSRASYVQFWTGVGALVQRGDSFVNKTFTYNQWLQIEDNVNINKVDIFPKELVGLQSISVV